MNQLIKYVGFRPVSASAGLWVNDLPGISDELGVALAESEDVLDADAEGVEGLAGLWKRLSGLAHETLLLELECLLSEKGAFRHELAYLPPLVEGSGELAANTAYVCRIKCRPMRFTRLYVDELAVVAVADGQVTMRVLRGTKVLDEATYTLTEGLNTLDLQLGYDNQRGQELRLEVTATVGLVGFAGTVEAQSDVCQSELLSLLAEGEDVEVVDPAVEVSARVGGDLTALVNRNALLLAPALQYGCGYQFMLEKLASDNFNVFTNTNRLVTEENRDAYQKQYREHLKRGAALIAKQLVGSRVLEATPDETGGWTTGSLV